MNQLKLTKTLFWYLDSQIPHNHQATVCHFEHSYLVSTPLYSSNIVLQISKLQASIPREIKFLIEKGYIERILSIFQIHIATYPNENNPFMIVKIIREVNLPADNYHSSRVHIKFTPLCVCVFIPTNYFSFQLVYTQEMVNELN